MFVRFNYIAWEQKSLISFHWTTVPVNKRRFSIGIFEFHAAISTGMFHKMLTSIWRISTNVLHVSLMSSTDIEQKILQRRVYFQYHEEKLHYEKFMVVKVI